LLNLIAEIVEKYDIHLETAEKKGRAAYLIKDSDKGSFFIKLQPPCGSFLSRIVRKICGGSLPFMNEYLMNIKMLNPELNDIKFPRMLYGAPGEYIVFEYIECKELVRLGQVKKISNWIGKELLLFNTMKPVENRNLIGRVIFYLLESPVLRILKQVKNSDFSLNIKLNIYKQVFVFFFQQPKLKPVLIHNDLSFSNLMDDCSDGYLLIDLEDSVASNRMVLVDAVDLLFDRENLILPIIEVENYWKKLSAKLEIDVDKLNLKAQIRLSVLRHILNSIFNPDFSGADQKKYYKFMKDKILDESEFNLWFEKGYTKSVSCKKHLIQHGVINSK